ncbi:SMC-Scp complex subunit ScpB [Cognatiyoonia sp. IB215182]|nr:SMC-Scp complex subunit ScpB [Cognatiyoonia sp. IB215182]
MAKVFLDIALVNAGGGGEARAGIGRTRAALRDLTAEGQWAALVIQMRNLESTEETIQLARKLACCAAALRTVAPKPRAKGSDVAVDLFLTEDAGESASMLSPRISEQALAFTEMKMGVLCAIAYYQPIDRAGLKDIFGKEVSRDLLARLRYKDLIASGPRSPRPGVPHTFVTTETFLVTFDLQSLRDLPELERSKS